MSAPLTKTQVMALVSSGVVHESFDHSIEGIFDITLMRAWAKANLTPIEIAVEEVVDLILPHRVLDHARIGELALSDALNDPALIILCQDGQYLYVDGHHRAMRLYREKVEGQLAYIIPYDKAARPEQGWTQTPDLWGEQVIEDGKIVPRSA